MMKFMNELGVEDSVGKRALPSKLKSYMHRFRGGPGAAGCATRA
jgi:hypothetical protein